MTRRSKRGQVLVEAMVAMGVLTTGFLGMMALLSRSFALTRTVADNYTATYLAAEGVEVVKNIVDANVIQGRAWNSGFADGAYEVEYDSLTPSPNQDRLLSYDPVSHLFSFRGGEASPFRRRIEITLVGSDEMKVKTVVSWTARGGGSFETSMEDHFLNWRS